MRGWRRRRLARWRSYYYRILGHLLRAFVVLLIGPLLLATVLAYGVLAVFFELLGWGVVLYRRTIRQLKS